MFTDNRNRLFGMVVTALLIVFAGVSVAAPPNTTNSTGSKKQPLSLTDQVRHELVTLPYFGVFDNLGFTVEGSDTVVLSGQVVRPMLKSEAETVVRRIQGISKVVNNIEVLPVSPFDNAIRLQTYRAIFSRTGFEKYATQAVSPIRIIVKNGDVTLEGVVGSKMDKILAEMAARSVFGVFSVTDNLTIG